MAGLSAPAELLESIKLLDGGLIVGCAMASELPDADVGLDGGFIAEAATLPFALGAETDVGTGETPASPEADEIGPVTFRGDIG